MRSGLLAVGGTSLFRLVEHPRAQDIFEPLAGAAILVRRFAEHPQWLRLGTPGDDEAFDRLGKALAGWRRQPMPPAASSPPKSAWRRTSFRLRPRVSTASLASPDNLLELALRAFATFFATVGPIDVAAFYAALTAHVAPQHRRRMAVKGPASRPSCC